MTAEVLRHNKKPKLNIAWDKDRGKGRRERAVVQGVQGDRINDHHLTRGRQENQRPKEVPTSS